MKPHLNTLYVTTDGASLSKQGESVCVRVEEEIKLRIPLLNLDGIVCFGPTYCSPALFGACAERGVTISFLDMNGRFLAAVIGFAPGNVALRRSQYRYADDSLRSCDIGRSFVVAKLANCRTVLLRGARDASCPTIKETLVDGAKRLAPILGHAAKATDLDELRGHEGVGARAYFSVFNALLRSEQGMVMEGRTRRPPLDPVNSMLSFVYSLLAHDVRSACECAGLDAAVGYLHRDRPGRPGLALDLMEEFRPFLADRLVISLINRGQVSPRNFTRVETGEFRLSDDGRKTILVAYQERKKKEIIHPYIKERVSIGILPLLQARLLARHIRGDLDGYPAFIWR